MQGLVYDENVALVVYVEGFDLSTVVYAGSHQNLAFCFAHSFQL